MHVQLWSYLYAPEPTGIGPVSAALAHELSDRGHGVDVVAAHPHYPEPVWGKRRLPYRESRDGIDALRLPLWIGRATAAQRMRQELTFTASLTAALPFLGKPDVIVAASPSFPALLPAVIYSRLRRLPLVLWLHDILPDGAMVTGLVREGRVLDASRWLERTAYENATRIVVLSRPFRENLRAKGVPDSKLELIYDPATRDPGPKAPPADGAAGDGPRVVCIGNIGHTQGLPPLVRAFDRSDELRSLGARLVITGTGVAKDEVDRQIESDAVELAGLVSDQELERLLQSANLAMVSQQYEGTEFNLPSKLMNYMAYGLPIVAAVDPGGEVARLVEESGSGWIANSSRPDDFVATVQAALSDQNELSRRGEAARSFAEEHFTREAFGARFESLLLETTRA